LERITPGLNNNLIPRSLELIQTRWRDANLHSKFSGLLEKALVFSAGNHSNEIKSRLVLLSDLCYQAAGGNAAISANLVAAWYVFNRAAHIMDNVQDNDAPEEWWAEQGTGVALSVASGLFFTASEILADLEKNGVASKAAIEVRQTFSSLLMKMSAGQYLDIVSDEPGLERYWEIAELKSGAFFAIASRCGARLASDDPTRLDGFESYGRQVGMLVQILDDLEDYQTQAVDRLPGLFKSGNLRSLPIVYALEMNSPGVRKELIENLHKARDDERAAGECWDVLEKCGAGLYTKMELARHRELALSALDMAKPRSPAREELIELVDKLSG
jgi:geranylgeranyl pyrophosphate synthase